MIKKDISTEEWREYNWIIPQTKEERTFKINYPLDLYYEKGSSCHVVTTADVDGNTVAICVPAVGHYGCVLTWRGKGNKPDVSFVIASRE